MNLLRSGTKKVLTLRKNRIINTQIFFIIPKGENKMEWLIISAIIICAILLLIAGVLRKKKGLDNKPSKIAVGVYQKGFILTKNEAAFFKNLKSALLPEYTIFAQVPFSCIVRVKEQYRGNQKLFWKINQKRVDFVILDENLYTRCIVELDDRSHDSKKESDQERDRLFASCGIKTYRFNSSTDNNIEMIKAKLEQYCVQCVPTEQQD